MRQINFGIAFKSCIVKIERSFLISKEKVKDEQSSAIFDDDLVSIKSGVK